MESFESGFSMQENKNVLTEEHVKHYHDGVGPVAPTGEVSDAELARGVQENQKDVEDPHVVCIDEREALEKQPVREKMAGGNVLTGYVAAELAGWSLFTDEQRAGSAETRVNAVADHLVVAGEKLGAHIDNHADDKKCKCGAADGCPVHVGVIAEHGNDKQFVDQMQDALGGNFNQVVWDGIIRNAQTKIARDTFDGWNGWIIINAVKARDGVVEVLNGDNQKPEADPENTRHNHWGEGVGINTQNGKSNDRDNAVIKHFQADAPALVRTCQKMAKDEAEFSRLLHAAVGFQFAVRYNLTSDQRNVYI